VIQAIVEQVVRQPFSSATDLARHIKAKLNVALSASRAQRRVESGAKRHAAELRSLLRLAVPGREAGTTFWHLQDHIGKRDAGQARSTHRSCVAATFGHWQATRQEVAQDLGRFYGWVLFRRRRYEAFCGRRSSEDKFVHRLRDTFGDVKCLFYGSWGAQPNLRHQPPSPGIGLRRRLASHFPVLVTPEPNTSSRCPHCLHGSSLCHPRRRLVRLRDGREEEREVHHLLRCTSPKCPTPWWHRDKLGASNVWTQGECVLRTGRLHFAFRYREAESGRRRARRGI